MELCLMKCETACGPFTYVTLNVINCRLERAHDKAGSKTAGLDSQSHLWVSTCACKYVYLVSFLAAIFF